MALCTINVCNWALLSYTLHFCTVEPFIMVCMKNTCTSGTQSETSGGNATKHLERSKLFPNLKCMKKEDVNVWRKLRNLLKPAHPNK